GSDAETAARGSCCPDAGRQRGRDIPCAGTLDAPRRWHRARPWGRASTDWAFLTTRPYNALLLTTGLHCIGHKRATDYLSSRRFEVKLTCDPQQPMFIWSAPARATRG